MKALSEIDRSPSERKSAMNEFKLVLRLCLTALVAVALASPAPADHCHPQHSQPEQASAPAAAGEPGSAGTISIPDVELVDQSGSKVRFYSDLVKDRVVAMNFVFTTCTTVCPPMGASFARLQRILDERGVDGVELISVSVDPAVDTPQRLEAWGEKFGRADGWTLVTGSRPDVNRLLKALQVFTPDKEEHSPIVLVGDDARDQWTRAYGLTPPARLADLVAGLTDAHGPAAATAREGR